MTLVGRMSSMEMKTTTAKTQPSESNRDGFSPNAEFHYPKTLSYPELLLLKN